MLHTTSQCAAVAADLVPPAQVFEKQQFWGKAEACFREAYGTCLREFGAEEQITRDMANGLSQLLNQRCTRTGVASTEAEVWEVIEVWEDLTEQGPWDVVPADRSGCAAKVNDVAVAAPFDAVPSAAPAGQATVAFEREQKEEKDNEEEVDDDDQCGPLQLHELQVAAKDVSVLKQQCVWHCLTPGASSTCEALEANALQATPLSQQGKIAVSWFAMTPQKGRPQLETPSRQSPQTACSDRRSDSGASAGRAGRDGDEHKLARTPVADEESPCSTFDGTSPTSDSSRGDAPEENIPRIPIRQAWDFPLSTEQKRLRLAYLFDQERVAVSQECRTLRRRLSASCDGRRSLRSSLSSRDSGSRRCSVGSLGPPAQLQLKHRRSRSPMQLPASF